MRLPGRAALVSLLLLSACRTSLHGGLSGLDAGDPVANPDLATACPGVFPVLDKACSTAADCFVAMHQIDCCGSFVAVGYAKVDQANFTSAEMACEHQYPGCGCPPRPTTADDGKTPGPMQTIAVDCVAGTCKTLVK